MISVGALDLSKLDQAYVVVVQLKTQPPGVLQQVTLRPDKIHDASQLIRLGETPQDEANCWIEPQNVNVMALLGTAKVEQVDKDDHGNVTREHWRVIPFPKPKQQAVA